MRHACCCIPHLLLGRNPSPNPNERLQRYHDSTWNSFSLVQYALNIINAVHGIIRLAHT